MENQILKLQEAIKWLEMGQPSEALIIVREALAQAIAYLSNVRGGK